MKTILIIFFAILPDKHWLVPMVSGQGAAFRPALDVGLRDALLLSQAPQTRPFGTNQANIRKRAIKSVATVSRSWR